MQLEAKQAYYAWIEQKNVYKSSLEALRFKTFLMLTCRGWSRRKDTLKFFGKTQFERLLRSSLIFLFLL